MQSEIVIEVSKFLGLVLTLITLFWGMSKRQSGLMEKHLDTRFATLAERLKQIERREGENGNQIARVERDLMNLRAELPEKYVRRDDYIRGQSLIESKLDALAIRIENLQLRGAKHD